MEIPIPKGLPPVFQPLLQDLQLQDALCWQGGKCLGRVKPRARGKPVEPRLGCVQMQTEVPFKGSQPRGGLCTLTMPSTLKEGRAPKQT